MEPVSPSVLALPLVRAALIGLKPPACSSAPASSNFSNYFVPTLFFVPPPLLPTIKAYSCVSCNDANTLLTMPQQLLPQIGIYWNRFMTLSKIFRYHPTLNMSRAIKTIKSLTRTFPSRLNSTSTPTTKPEISSGTMPLLNVTTCQCTSPLESNYTLLGPQSPAIIAITYARRRQPMIFSRNVTRSTLGLLRLSI
jgi:hypothetical protein